MVSSMSRDEIARRYGSADKLDALDFQMDPGCVLAQLGGLAGEAAWYSDRYEQLRWKHWPSVLAWNLAISSVMSVGRLAPPADRL